MFKHVSVNANLIVVARQKICYVVDLATYVSENWGEASSAHQVQELP